VAHFKDQNKTFKNGVHLTEYCLPNLVCSQKFYFERVFNSTFCRLRFLSWHYNVLSAAGFWRSERQLSFSKMHTREKF